MSLRHRQFNSQLTQSRSSQYGTQDFQKGSICHVQVENFMAYTQAEFQLGPSLNLIVGPNGSGKSSFVCAVCIGLGGSPKLLGRGTQERLYIKRGFEQAKIEITLSMGNQRTRTITRQIKIDHSRTDNEEGSCVSQWKIDGQTVIQKKVQELVKELSIQLNNLCQFLPQDKVQDFSKMNAKELLESTEKAIEDSSLYDRHQELKTLSQELQSSQLALTRTQQDLDYNTEQINGMRRDVVRVQERDRLMKEKEVIECRIQQQNYLEAEQEFEKTKKQKEVIQKEIKERQNAFTKDQQECSKINKEMVNLNQELGVRFKAYEGSKKSRDKTSDKLEDLFMNYYTVHQQIQNHAQELEAKKLEVQRQQATIQKLQNDYNILVQEKEGLSQNNNQQKQSLRQELQQIDKQVRQNNRSISDLQDQFDEAARYCRRLEDELNKQSGHKYRQLNDIKKDLNGQQHIVDAYNWINKNRNKFRGNIYGPILTELNFQKPLHAQMFENHVPKALLTRFVVEFQEDQRVLLEEFKNNRQAHKGYVPHVTYYAGDFQRELDHPLGTGENFAKYGIEGTLDQYLECPSIIKHVLKDESRISEAFVGTSDAYDKLEAISQQTKINMLLTPNYSVRMKVSAYNQSVKTQSHNNIRQLRLLLSTVKDNTNLERQQAELNQYKQKMAQLSEQQNEIKGQQQELANQKAYYDQQLQAITKAENDYNKSKRQIENNIKTNQSSFTISKRQLQEMSSTNKLQLELTAVLKELKSMKTLYKEQVLKVDETLWEYQKVLVEIDVIRLKDEGARYYLAEAEQQLKMKSANLEYINRIHKEANENKSRLAKFHRFQEDKMKKESKEMKEFFKDLPTQVNELEIMVIRRQSEADSIQLFNPDAVNEYRNLERSVQELTKKLQANSTQFEIVKRKVDEIRGPWIEQLRDIFHQIDQNFQQNFRDLGNYGNINLKECGDNYQDYCVELRVKFRDTEELTVLDRNRHSGGERSVSTILYLIAMQQRTHCPFRVIDEINQGMDQENERKVFKFLVESVNRADSPQIFLITPKVLPNLHYSDIVTVLQIFTGHTIDQESQNVSMDQVIGDHCLSQSQIEPAMA